jgi:LAS superfamily LD-carboxypeptidase LdcB
MHKDVERDWLTLKARAKSEGIELLVASSFRSFDRQLKIWNDKFLGKRPVYDCTNNLVDLTDLTDWQKVEAILAFSAIPGTSRHHWGTDFDVYDGNAITLDYRLQLTPSEYSCDGPFNHLNIWLSQQASTGLFRPYVQSQYPHLKVAEEPWHISFTPRAAAYEAEFVQNKEDILAFIVSSDILGNRAIAENFDHILDYYIVGANRS